MKEIIIEKLKEIEQINNVKVLFAVESGSRAWGFPSKDSDYDVRFVYIRHPDWYLSIDEKRDVIEVPINDMLDINGWDIRKALKLLRKSNPPLLEWLVSEIVYSEDYGFKNELLKIKESVFSPKASMHHYLSMAHGNYREYLRGDQVKIKKYFYVLRPILACKWIEKYNTNPPILFQDLIEDLITDDLLLKEINSLLRRKMAGDEMDYEKRIDVINKYVEFEIEHLTEYLKDFKTELQDPTQLLDELYRKYLNLVWNM